MRCFACHAVASPDDAERVGFRDECEVCRADLHVCRNCRFHDPAAYNACRESSAERVSDTERANRCEYFAPDVGEGGTTAPAAAALADLEALFDKD